MPFAWSRVQFVGDPIALFLGVFHAAGQTMLDKVKEGDKVKFHVEKMNGALTITKIEGDK